MAAKKNTAPEDAILQEAPAVPETKAVPEKTEEPKVNKWEQMETVRVPRKSKHDFYYVCVNDRRFEIPADGKEHEMPHPIAEVLRQTIEAEYAVEDFAEHIPNKGAEKV